MTSVPFPAEFHGEAEAHGLGRLDDGVRYGIPRCYQPGRDYPFFPATNVLDSEECEAPASAADILHFPEAGDKGVGYAEHLDQLWLAHGRFPHAGYTTPRDYQRASESDRFLSEASPIGYPTLKRLAAALGLLLAPFGWGRA